MFSASALVEHRVQPIPKAIYLSKLVFTTGGSYLKTKVPARCYISASEFALQCCGDKEGSMGTSNRPRYSMCLFYVFNLTVGDRMSA